MIFLLLLSATMPSFVDAPSDQNRVDLYTALSASYGDQSAGERLMQKGYSKDERLSDHRQQIWYNPHAEGDKKLLMTVAGTHNNHDKLTDVRLLFGGLKNTRRYQSAKKTLEKAKAAYNTSTATLVGHSLGGSIVQGIANKDDNVLAANAGFTFGGKAKKEHRVVRTTGDVISLLGRGQKTVSSGLVLPRPLKAHKVDRFKGKAIYL